MTTFLLIRHALHTLGGETIAGRIPDVPLSPQGQAQAERLAERLKDVPVRAVYCSPIQRARETAQPLATRQGLPLQICEEINEIDFGDWMGRRLEELKDLSQWRRFNAFRSGTRIPNGELMLETQLRIISHMEWLREQYPEDCLALVSHGDVIKSAVAYYLGVHLDLFQRIEIRPASVSIIAIEDYGPWVLCVNNTEDLPVC